MSRATVLLADDHAIVAEGLASLRIERVGARLCAKADCQALRERRRALAHEPESSVAWSDVEGAVEVVERELQARN